MKIGSSSSRIAALAAACFLVWGVCGATEPAKKPAPKPAPKAGKATPATKKDACTPADPKEKSAQSAPIGVCAPPAAEADGQKFNTFEDIYSAPAPTPPATAKPE